MRGIRLRRFRYVFGPTLGVLGRLQMVVLKRSVVVWGFVELVVVQQTRVCEMLLIFD